MNQLTNKYLELDIYFPKLHRAIEVDGVLYHGKHKDSSLFVNVDKVIAKDALKDRLCSDASIKLLRVTDLELHKDTSAVLSLIEDLLGD